MSTEQYSITSAERAVQHEQYLLWYDSTPAGRARQHGSSQRKKTKLNGAPVVHHTTQNMVRNTPILPHQKAYICYPTSTTIDNSSLHQQPRPSVATEKPPYNNTSIASQQQQGRISKLQSKAPARTNTRESTRAKTDFGKARLTAAVTPVTVHATCSKDRHSKVRTAMGLRDRRVRLSAPTAVRFFDVLDRLGYDQPSKAMDWLIKKAQAAIEDLAPVKSIVLAGDEGGQALGTATEEINRYQNADEQCEKEDQQSNRGVTISSPTSGARAISRVRAQDIAKVKSNRDNLLPKNAETSAPSVPTSPAISMSPEILLLSQFQQPSSEPVLSRLIPPLQPSNFASAAILPQSATSHIMPSPTHFFRIPPKTNAPFIFHDFPTLVSSATSSYHTNNNTLISPRGTLQSIFIDSITSPVSAMQSYDMMGPCGDIYEAGGTGDSRSTDVSASSVDLCIPLSIHSQEYPKMHLPL